MPFYDDPKKPVSVADESNNWRSRKPVESRPDLEQHNQPNNKNNQNRYNRQYVNYGDKRIESALDIVPIRIRLPKKPDNKEIPNWRSAAAAPNLPPYCHPDDRNRYNKRELYKPFLSENEMEKGIQDGSLYGGIMRLSKNREDAYVTSENLDADIYIGGSNNRNRSLQGDFVVVRLVELEAAWELKKKRDAKKHQDWVDRMKLKEGYKEEDISKLAYNNDDDEEEDAERHKPKYCGEVVGILYHPSDTTFSGSIMINRTNDVVPGQNNKLPERLSFAWFKPTDKRVPFIKLLREDIPQDLIANHEFYSTHLFSASIRRWQITETNPVGKIEKLLGPIGDLLAEKASIISDNNVISNEFSSQALQGLPKLPWTIPEKEIKARRDLRSKRIFSVDPITAKDLDDALHIEPLDGGFYEVGVHIADVSYFLKRGSVLDSEASTRGTSTYLVDGVIPMLPKVLCEELCSLNPGVDRLAFSVVWKMDSEGNLVDTWFGKTVIRSCAKLAYQDAQCVIDNVPLVNNLEVHDSHDFSDIASDILSLNSIALQRRQKRYESGSLSLNSVKLNFELDENGEPESVFRFEAQDANRMIEEFMLCANISVAKHIANVFPEEALLRRHEEPLEKRLDDFLKLTDALGLDFDGSTAGTLQKSFNKVHNKEIKDALLVLAIRCMQRAKYFCAGVADISKYGHYALNEPLYTHFTSPIRRYADVIVHRLLEASLKEKVHCDYEKKQIQKITFGCNSKKEGAKNAQDASSDLYLARYLSKLEIEKSAIYTKATVIKLSKDNYEIYLPQFGIEKKVRLVDLPTEQFFFDKSRHTLEIFWRHGIPVSMFNEEKFYAQERIRKDDYSDEEDEEEKEENEEDNDLGLGSMSLESKFGSLADDVDYSVGPVPSVVLEPNTGLQRLRLFCSIDVRLQVNTERSPPIVNIYPVNPYCGQDIKEYI